MDKNITNLIKFICCLLIFFHHYFILEIMVSAWGRIACSVFFFLSAYGVCKSLQRSKYGFIIYSQKRLSKIYLPYVLINILAILGGGFLIGDFVIPEYKLIGHELFFLKDFSLFTLINYTAGFNKIDGAMWFLDVLLISYVFIWFIEGLSSKWMRLFLAITIPVILLILDRVLNTSWICMWPTDTIGIIAGIIYFEFESKFNQFIMKYYKMVLTFAILLWILFVGLYTLGLNSPFVAWRYMEMTILLYSFFSICIVICLSLKIKVNHPSMCSFLGGVSFFVYLSHIKVIDVLAYFQFKPLVAYAFVFVLLTSIFLYYGNSIIQKTIWTKHIQQS